MNASTLPELSNVKIQIFITHKMLDVLISFANLICLFLHNSELWSYSIPLNEICLQFESYLLITFGNTTVIICMQDMYSVNKDTWH